MPIRHSFALAWRLSHVTRERVLAVSMASKHMVVESSANRNATYPFRGYIAKKVNKSVRFWLLLRIDVH